MYMYCTCTCTCIHFKHAHNTRTCTCRCTMYIYMYNVHVHVHVHVHCMSMCIIMRSQFWQLLKDCRVHHAGLSIWEADVIAGTVHACTCTYMYMYMYVMKHAHNATLLVTISHVQCTYTLLLFTHQNGQLNAMCMMCFLTCVSIILTPPFPAPPPPCPTSTLLMRQFLQSLVLLAHHLYSHTMYIICICITQYGIVLCILVLLWISNTL